MVGPFIFVDEFGPARLPAGQGMDVRPHPHINLATVTYLFEGAIEHRDSIGSHRGDRARRDQPDDRGQRASSIRSARPQAIRPAGPSLYGMQTWLALPDGQRGDRSGVRPCRRPTACRWSRTTASRARVLMGELVGRGGGDAAAFADHLCRHRARRRRRDPDRCRGRRARGDAGRRRGRARRPAARAVRALRPRARPCGAAVERERRAGDAAGRRRRSRPRATCSGTSSPRRATGSTRPRRTGRRCASR